MVPRVYHYLLVKETMQLVEVRCKKCGRRRVLPRHVRLEKIKCLRCGSDVATPRVTA